MISAALDLSGFETDALVKARSGLFTVAAAIEATIVERARMLATNDVLNVRTGDYLQSIKGGVSVLGDSVVGFVHSDAPAGGILETGGDIPAHDILPSVGSALRFTGSAGEVFAAVVHDPGGTIREHSVIHAAYDDLVGNIEQQIVSAGTNPW